MTRKLASLFLASALLAGCGMIADKNNIRVAMMDGEAITRGDVYDYLRAFPENERPQVNNQGDLLMVLNRMLDERLKVALVEEKGDAYPSTINRDAMREQFFRSLGDEADQYRAVWSMEVPADGKATPLMEVYGLTAEGMSEMKRYIEERTEAMFQRARGDEVLAMVIREAFQKGELPLDEKSLALEYKFREADLKRPESVTFTAIRFPASPEGAKAAADVRTALGEGKSFSELAQANQAKDASSVFEGTLSHDPNNSRMESFWTQATGAEINSIIGPLFMPETQQVAIDANGQERPVVQPESYLIALIQNRTEERTLTIEESKPLLAPPLLISAMMQKLRQQHGVEIFEDNLADPSDFSGIGQKPLA